MDQESKVARCFQYFPITSQFLPCHTPLPFLDTLTKLHYRIWNCDSIRVHKTNAGDTNRVGLSVPAIKRAAGASESRRASGGSWALKSGATGNMAVATPTKIKRTKKKVAAISQYNGSASYNLTPRNPAGILGGDQIFVDHLSKLHGQRDKHYCTVCFPRAFNYKDSWESIKSIQPIWRFFLKKFITPWSVSHRPPKKEPPDPLHWDPGGSSPSQVGSKSVGIEIVQKDAKGSPSTGRILIKNGLWQRNVFIISSRAHFWRFDSFGKHHNDT